MKKIADCRGLFLINLHEVWVLLLADFTSTYKNIRCKQSSATLFQSRNLSK